MIYRVTANMFFNVEDEALDFVHDCEVAMDKAVVVNPDQPNQEGSSITLEKCFHDQTPTEPCIPCGAIHCP